jgi:hypothetical protein
MAQPNCAPQRLQVLMRRGRPAGLATIETDKDGRCHAWVYFLIK